MYGFFHACFGCATISGHVEGKFSLYSLPLKKVNVLLGPVLKTGFAGPVCMCLLSFWGD